MYRYLKGMTQETLAKEAQVNESTICNCENGKHKPFGKTLQKLTVLLTAGGIKI
jgi:DNA-binding XRE family transcriptional regulator